MLRLQEAISRKQDKLAQTCCCIRYRWRKEQYANGKCQLLDTDSQASGRPSAAIIGRPAESPTLPVIVSIITLLTLTQALKLLNTGLKANMRSCSVDREGIWHCL